MQILRISAALACTALSLFTIACGKPTQVAQVTFTSPDLYPEGVVYDAPRSRFLVSSLRQGVIGAVTDAGAYEVFIEDERLVSAIGLHIDRERNRLIVCISDPGVSVRTKAETQKKLAGLAVYALSDGKLLHYENLAANDPDGFHFANDAVTTADGTIYVTNSFSPVIYKITPDYKSSEFLRDDRFGGEGFGLNGIEIVGDALIVARYNEGVLFRIPLADPSAYAEIAIDRKFPGADGLAKIDDSTLALISNRGAGQPEYDRAFTLTSADGWKSARVAGEVQKPGMEFPTTADVRGGEVYVLNAKLNRLFGGATEPTNAFEIFNISR